ncbi:MAG: glycosyltransferase, partial [Acinetobacter sp.]
MIRNLISKFNVTQDTTTAETVSSKRASQTPVANEKTHVKPLLSVIVPCYKVESYLRGTLDTIMAQNEIPIEVIVVDDGSPDRSGDIAREYAANDARIVVITQANAGLGAARNTGIKAATAKYLTFADSD